MLCNVSIWPDLTMFSRIPFLGFSWLDHRMILERCSEPKEPAAFSQLTYLVADLLRYPMGIKQKLGHFPILLLLF